MTKAEISVEFTRFEPVRLREEVAGHARVRCLEPLDCQAIDLAVGYRVRGEGVGGEAVVQEIKGEPLHLTPERPFEKEFKFRLPDQPISYAGHYFSLAWFVRVKVRLRFRIDIVEDREFEVRPARFQPRPAVASTFPVATGPAEQVSASPAEEAPRKKGINPILVGVFFLVAGGAAVFWVGFKGGPQGKVLDPRLLIVAFAGMLMLIVGSFWTPIAIIVQLFRWLYRRPPKPSA